MTWACTGSCRQWSSMKSAYKIINFKSRSMLNKNRLLPSFVRISYIFCIYSGIYIWAWQCGVFFSS